MKNQPSNVRKLLLVATASVSALYFVPLVSAGQAGAYPTPEPPPAVNPTDVPNNTPTNQANQQVQNQPAADNQNNVNNSNLNSNTSNSISSSDNNNTARTPHLPDGFVEKDENGADGIKSTLVGLTQRAVTKDSYDSFFTSFLSELAKHDKERAQEFKGANQDQLNATITQIQNEWQTKYGQAFDINDKNLVFNDQFTIVQGEVSDQQTAYNNWPLSASSGQAIQAGASSDQQQCNQKTLTQGRAVAVVSFPAGNGLPAVRVSLTHQMMSGWYVELPADRSGEQIYNDLSSHLNHIASHQDRWPADVNDGYRMVAREVAAALYGVPTTGGTASIQ
jgi:hypothetical protein